MMSYEKTVYSSVPNVSGVLREILVTFSSCRIEESAYASKPAVGPLATEMMVISYLRARMVVCSERGEAHFGLDPKLE